MKIGRVKAATVMSACLERVDRRANDGERDQTCMKLRWFGDLRMALAAPQSGVRETCFADLEKESKQLMRCPNTFHHRRRFD